MGNKVYLINYANRKFRKEQLFQNLTAKRERSFNKIFSFLPSDIDNEFYFKNNKILDCSKGSGYWLWKAYFIKKILSKIEYGDYLMYLDAGVFFVDNIKLLLNISTKNNQDVIPFELVYKEKMYTKGDAFRLMGLDESYIADSNQRLACYIIFRKSDFSIRFVDEWLGFCCNVNILTDKENEIMDNYPEFIAHRHDQSVFSLLTKKYNLKAYRDPSQFGNNLEGYKNMSPYKQILYSTRWNTWSGYFKNIYNYYFKRSKSFKNIR